MIEYIKRKDLDTNKYDACIENSIQSRIYAFSWYLDIVADNWDVLVLNDYEAVMPIPWRKKFFIKYVYTPLRVLELGVFSFNKVDLEVFSNMLCKKFFYANLRFNSENRLINFSEVLTEKQQQYVLLKDDYEIILDNYRKDRKKDLNKAKKAGLTEEWNDSVENLIHLFKNNVGKRFKGMSVNDYQIMEEIVKRCIDEKKGQVLSIYDKDKRLVSSGFFIKNNKKISILFSKAALAALETYSWPGNVRQLANVIERAVVLTPEGFIDLDNLPQEITGTPPRQKLFQIPLGTPLDEIDRLVILETLRITGGNKTKAARLLGISPRTIYRKLE